MTYIKKENRDTWHFHPECQHFQRYIKLPKGIVDWRASKPKSGELCDECKGRAGKK